MTLVHWDNVEAEQFDLGPISGRWRDLGSGVRSVRVGASRIEVTAGHQSTPLHAHGSEEELFYVLGGRGHSVTEEGACAIGRGDAILYPAGGPAHTLVGGDRGLDVVAFGPRHNAEAIRFPRFGGVKVGGMIVDGRTEHQWQREAEQGLVEVVEIERPSSVVNIDAIPPVMINQAPTKGSVRFLGRTLGAETTALNYAVIAPNSEGAPMHCHSAVSELFVVIAGDGILLLARDGEPEEEVRLLTGTVVSRPAGTGLAHGFRSRGEGMTLLMYSDRDPNDMCFYPRTRKVALRGLGITIQPEIVPFWGD